MPRDGRQVAPNDYRRVHERIATLILRGEECQSAGADAGKLDHLAPLFGFVGD